MDKNISEMNAWLTKRMNVFKPGKDSEKLSMKLPKGLGPKTSAPQKPTPQEADSRRSKDEIDHYKIRVQQLREESNALYKDLITLRRDKSQFYENFAKENNEVIMQMIHEIHRAEDEIVLLEQEMESGAENNEKILQKIEKSGKDGKGMSDDPTKGVDRDVLRAQQEEAKEALRALKEIVTKLKEQLANFHNYISALNADGRSEKHGDQLQNNAQEMKKKERMKKYDTLLRELGIK